MASRSFESDTQSFAALGNLGAWSLTGPGDFQLLHDGEYFRGLGTIAIVRVRLRITAVAEQSRRLVSPLRDNNAKINVDLAPSVKTSCCSKRLLNWVLAGHEASGVHGAGGF